MNELHWTELAAHVVAWHNRHPLARHIGVQHVHSLGYVMLPFVDADANTKAAPAAAAAPPTAGEPLPPEAMTGSLRERALARAQLQAHDAAAQPDDAPPRPAAPAHVRPAFDEDFMPPYTPRAVQRWAAKQAVAQTTPRGDVQVRKVRAEPGLDQPDVLPRWVLTAQVEVGSAKTRVLVGPGTPPAVLGRRMISPGRTIALFALAGLLAGVAGWVVDRQPVAPALAAASAAMAPAPHAPLVMASAPAPGLDPMKAHKTESGAVVVSHQGAPARAASAEPVLAAASTATAAPTAERPVDVEPRLGKIALPSLGPRVDERRRRAQETAASAASVVPAAPPAPPASSAPTAAPQPAPPRNAMAPAPPGPSFAVTTRLLRTRSESDQVAAAMRDLLASQPGPPVRVEVLAVGDDWRVVGWPYLDRALADKARALLAARGMKVQVIDF